MAKPNSSLTTGPVDELMGNPSDYKQASGVWDGEPNMPQRTSSPNAVPELTRDTEAGLTKKS